jgi:hypothetical protein
MAFHFVIQESFKAAGPVGSEAIVQTGSGGGDCGYPFAIGQSYLIYADQGPDGNLRTGICSPTHPAVMAAAVIRELRALRDHKPLDAIFGIIGQAPRGSGFDSLPEFKPLSGVPVHATSSDGATYSTQTDASGVFAFASPSSGDYRVESELPSGYAPSPAPREVEITTPGFGCRIEQLARPGGLIQGTVRNSAGEPLAGFVTVQPANPEDARAARLRGGLPGFTVGPDGKFFLTPLPPDRYLLVFHPQLNGQVDFRATSYWPADSTAIDLAFGQHLTGIEVKVTQ